MDFSRLLYATAGSVDQQSRDEPSCSLQALQKEASTETSSPVASAASAELWAPSKSDFKTLLKPLLSLKSVKPREKKTADAMKKTSVEFNESQSTLARSVCGDAFAVERDLDASGKKLITNDLPLAEESSSSQSTDDEKRERLYIDASRACILRGQAQIMRTSLFFRRSFVICVSTWRPQMESVVYATTASLVVAPFGDAMLVELA